MMVIKTGNDMAKPKKSPVTRESLIGLMLKNGS
jgi:hypothetical protein